jgi:site-specific DNA-methyltransferase (adenine-specific)
MTKNNIYHDDCLKFLNTGKSETYDCILTDPPYLYLKGQKLEREFDETVFFSQCKRVLKKNGFIIIFGRGSSFYRWCTILTEMEFTFKEEIIWDKGHTTSPLMSLSRVHETIAIFTKGTGTINKVKVPYLEMKKYDWDGIVTDIKRLKVAFNNTNALNAILSFIENNLLDKTTYRKKSTTISSNTTFNADRQAAAFRSIAHGMNEKSIIRTDAYENENFTKFGVNSDKRQNTDRQANAFQSMTLGMNEKSIIRETRDHYSAIHPTQKPIKLLYRLLKLTTKLGDNVLDPFSGSGSTTEACINLGLNSDAIEIDEEYYLSSIQRIKPLIQAKTFELL